MNIGASISQNGINIGASQTDPAVTPPTSTPQRMLMGIGK